MTQSPSNPDQSVPTPVPADQLLRQAKVRVSTVSRESMEFMAGPLPPPSALEEYNRVCPGCAERIIAMAEKEGVHRREMEKEIVGIQKADLNSERMERRRGQLLGFGVCLAAILGGVYLASTSPGIAGQIGGSLLGTSGLTSLILAFITGRSTPSRSKQAADQERKSAATKPE